VLVVLAAPVSGVSVLAAVALAASVLAGL